jgi:hypothetical protein
VIKSGVTTKHLNIADSDAEDSPPRYGTRFDRLSEQMRRDFRDLRTSSPERDVQVSGSFRGRLLVSDDYFEPKTTIAKKSTRKETRDAEECPLIGSHLTED